MAIKQYDVELTFEEGLLGTIPKNKQFFDDFIAKNNAEEEVQEDEMETAPDTGEGRWTTFHTLDDGTPILYDYVIKGFCKDACGMLRRVPGTASNKVKSYKKMIDGLVFVTPRQIPIIFPEGEEMQTLDRPLRCVTPRGERVTIIRSDMTPIGSTITFNLMLLGGLSKKVLKEWFEYGNLRGLGQWRNAGYGRFSSKLTEK